MSQQATSGEVRRPVPEPSELTLPFWEAARRGELALQCCTGCNRFHHPPVVLCPDCHSTTFTYRAVSGAGTVNGYSILRQPRVAGLESLVPYACLAVEIDEQAGVIVMGNLLGVPADSAGVGMRVQVCFEPLGEDDLVLPQFRPLGMDG